MTTEPRSTDIQPPAPNPCGSCPYRTDVPSGIWHASEYAKLPAYDADTPHQPPGVFLCHQVDGHICAGWAACHDMTNSLAVRLAASSGRLSPDDVDTLMDYTTPVPVFSTGQAAAEHGLTDHDHPSPAAERAIDKIATRHTRHPGEPMNFINLTPHDVIILDEDGNETTVYPPSGDVARLATRELTNLSRDAEHGVKLVSFGSLQTEPPETGSTRYIVSLPTALAVRRPDFLVPYQEVRDDHGRIIGCRYLARVL